MTNPYKTLPLWDHRRILKKNSPILNVQSLISLNGRITTRLLNSYKKPPKPNSSPSSTPSSTYSEDTHSAIPKNTTGTDQSQQETHDTIMRVPHTTLITSNDGKASSTQKRNDNTPHRWSASDILTAETLINLGYARNFNDLIRKGFQKTYDKATSSSEKKKFLFKETNRIFHKVINTLRD